MKTVQLGFLYIALICVVCAIWLPDLLWQYLITAGVLLIAAAGIEASHMSSEKDDQK